MAINIQTIDTIIPVTIGKLNFEIDTSDKSTKIIREKAQKMEVKIKEIEELLEIDEEQAEAEIEAYLQQSFDDLLGRSAFEMIYAQTPSIHAIAKYFVQLVQGLEQEMSVE